MKKILTVAFWATTILVSPSLATAQQVTGGDVGIAYAGLTDSDLETAGFRLDGSVEYAVNREVALQGDLAYTSGEVFGLNGDVLSLGVHGIYHANENASFGFFLGRENTDGGNSTFYGVEAGYGNGPTSVEGYFGIASADSGIGVIGDIDLNQFGLMVNYDVSDRFEISGRYDNLRFTDAATANRFGVGVDYQVSSNFSAGAEIGQLHGDLAGFTADETYANVTATISFGAKRGATFEQRDSLSTLIGF